MTIHWSRSAAALILAGFGGAAIAFFVFPADMLLGARSYWDHVQGDNGTSVIGFYALAHVHIC